MLRLDFQLRPGNVEGIADLKRDDLRRRLALGIQRAADVALGFLRRYSTSGPIQKRSGTLARAWGVEPDASDPLVQRIVNRMIYAAIHEAGGTITPKTAKMLAVPIPGGPALTPSGVARYSSPRDVPGGLFMFKSKKGNLLLAQKLGKDKLELYYVLKERVTIPASHYATLALEASRASAEQQVRNAIEK